MLMMTVPDRITPGYLVPRRCGELPAACEESAAIIIGVTARRVVTRGVMVQKSAAAMVVSDEPPTAHPHGGWCGGWELKAPGYPIGRHVALCRTNLT